MLRLSDSTDRAARPRARAAPLVDCAGLRRSPALWIAALAFVLYVPVAANVLLLGPDPLEYLDLARHVAAGDGYLLSIKAYYFDNSGVIHDGLAERAPLFTYLAAAILRLGLGYYAVQVANALLSAGCAALVCAIGTTLYGRRTGILAGLLAAASPPVLIHLVLPMSEALSIFLTLLAAWLFVRDLDAPRARTYAAAGVVLGLGYLTRPLTLALAAGLLLGVVLATRARGRLLGPLAALALSLALCVVPISLYSLATRGSLSYMGQAWYSIMEDNDIIFNATLRPLPSPAEFVAANRDAVFVAIIRKIRLYVNLVFLDGRWLLPLLPASLTLVPALVRGRVPRAVWPVLSMAGTNFLLYGLSWSLYARRYQVLTLLLLLPLMVDGLVRLGLPRLQLRRGPPLSALQLAVALVVLFWLQTFIQQYGGTFQEAGGGELVGTRTYQGLRWTGTPSWMQDRDLPRLLDWVGANTADQDIVAHPSPWIVTFFTARPSALLPRRLDAETFRRFLVEYRVAYVLLRNDDVYWRRYGDDLLELAGSGVTAVGNYRVFDTRALWR